MDPVACIVRAIDAAVDGDREEVAAAVADYRRWIRADGFHASPSCIVDLLEHKAMLSASDLSWLKEHIRPVSRF